MSYSTTDILPSLGADLYPPAPAEASRAAVEERAWFPFAAVATVGLSLFLLVILGAAEGFHTTWRAVSLGLAGASFTGFFFLLYRNIRNEQMVAHIFGALGLMVVMSYIGAYLGMVSLITPIPLQDQRLMEWSLAVGVDYEATMRWIAAHPPLGRFLDQTYLATGPLTFLAPLALGLTRQFARLRVFVTLYAVLLLACILISMLTPASGFALYKPFPPDLKAALPWGAADFYRPVMEGVRAGSIRLLDPSTLEGVVEFPSFHTAMSILSVYGLWRTRRLWWICLVINLVVLTSIVPIGGHYIWDMVASVALFAAALPLARRWSLAPADRAA